MYNIDKYFNIITNSIQNLHHLFSDCSKKGTEWSNSDKRSWFSFLQAVLYQWTFLLIVVYLRNRSIILVFNSMLPIVRSFSIRKFFCFTVCCYSAAVFFMKMTRTDVVWLGGRKKGLCCVLTQAVQGTWKPFNI